MMPYMNMNPSYFNPVNPAYPFINQSPQNILPTGSNMSGVFSPNNMSGKIVDDFNSITASDIPMDGNPATFIKRDGSEIQLRTWTSNGTISTTSYKPVTIETPVKTETDVFADFREEVYHRFDKLEKALNVSRKTTKKECDIDEQ